MSVARLYARASVLTMLLLATATAMSAVPASADPGVLPGAAPLPSTHPTPAVPTVIAEDGGSRWSYQDAHDATPKREGGYLPFNYPSAAATRYAAAGAAYSIGGGFYDQAGFQGFGPHGGYDTSTNKCKACHAVHRAEGSYYLLRAATQDDACAYCHIGPSAKSADIVYTGNPAGPDTPNGHTIGASSRIPGSTVHMVSVSVELVPGRANTRVKVRQYDESRKQLFRIVPSRAGQPGHPETGAGTGVQWSRVGPTPLSCSSCHQVHNATSQIWRPQAFKGLGATDAQGFLRFGYKLLRRFPGASAQGNPAPGVTIPGEDLAKVPESRLVEGVNYSPNVSFEQAYLENTEVFSQPDWVVGQGFTGGPMGSATPVNQYALSVWCADCHNLNIGGGRTRLGDSELGYFPVHAERTHPVPSIAAVAGTQTGGFQCYSCHRGDLDYGVACSACHYTPVRYRIAAPTADFPHADSDQSFKLLGAFSVNVARLAQGWFDYEYLPTTITRDNLDAVCLRCHAVAHRPFGGLALNHIVPPAYAQCAMCHGTDSAVIHDATPSGCNACHAAAVLTFDCSACHFATLAQHPVPPGAHALPAPYDAECGSCHGLDAAAIHTAAPAGCFSCHGVTPLTARCSACHFATFAQHPYPVAAHTATVAGMTISGTWPVPVGAPDGIRRFFLEQSYTEPCGQCHLMDLGAEHAKPTASSAARGCMACHPDPVSTLAGAWAGGCQQGGCHPTIHTSATMEADHVYGATEFNAGCGAPGCHVYRGGPTWTWCADYAQVHDHRLHWYRLQPLADGCDWCHTPTVVPTRVVSCSSGACHDAAWILAHVP